MQQYDVYNVVVFFTGFVYDACICYSVFFNEQRQKYVRKMFKGPPNDDEDDDSTRAHERTRERRKRKERRERSERIERRERKERREQRAQARKHSPQKRRGSNLRRYGAAICASCVLCPARIPH